MKNEDRIKSIIEALLMVSESGLAESELMQAITDTDVKTIREAIRSLREEYESPARAFNIAEISGRYRIVTKPEYMPWISNLYQKEVDRLTGPSLETLAIIAYKQPVTRAEVEGIRGVNVGGMLKTLMEKDLIKVKGRKDAAGRPLLYATTDKFLEIFGLNSLDDLPVLRDFSEEDLEFSKPREQVEAQSPDGGMDPRETVTDDPSVDDGSGSKSAPDGGMATDGIGASSGGETDEGKDEKEI